MVEDGLLALAFVGAVVLYAFHERISQVMGRRPELWVGCCPQARDT